jgi:sortase A
MGIAPGLALLAGGSVVLAVALAPVIGGMLGQRQAEERWARILTTPFASHHGEQVGSDLFRPVDGLDFKLTVPRLGYSEVVREGVALDVLARGPGHYPRTAWPGQPGDVGVAAHNVYWLRFGELSPGDEIVLEARYGLFRYRVTGSTVVTPGETWVLDSAPGRHLTLTTCWPLWAGQFTNRRLAIFAYQEVPGARTFSQGG